MKKNDIKIAHTPKRFFEAAKEHAVGSNGGLCCTCTADAPKTDKQEMLAALHDADAWHEQRAAGFAWLNNIEEHKRFQKAIWWALEQLDDERITIRAT